MEHYAQLEQDAAFTEIGAKRKAEAFDVGCWCLPRGNYITLPQGIVVPRGSELVARRVDARAKWKPVTAKEGE